MLCRKCQSSLVTPAQTVLQKSTPGSTMGKATPGALLQRNVVLRQHRRQGSLKCPCPVSLLNNDPSRGPRNYLQIIIQAAAEVHVTQRHVRQLGTEEAAQLSTDIHGCLLGPGLLIRWDSDLPPIISKELFLQRQTQAGFFQLHLTPFGRWLGLCGSEKVCKTEGKPLIVCSVSL